jgi:diketogulonate reductase-like aldo/keto reductase
MPLPAKITEMPMFTTLPVTKLAGGEAVPILGQGTWMMGERGADRRKEADALRLGLDLGMALIDTAEMYGSGGAEEVVAEAIAGRRESVFLVSKVLPSNASRSGVPAACDRSLRRLKTDRIDLYLYHWRGGTPLAETIEALERLRQSGKVRHWGVSNFDTDDMQELALLPEGAQAQTNQILYNLSRRGPEFDLLPWQRERGMPIMAYSPVEQGSLTEDSRLTGIAGRHDATPAQIALAWTIRNGDVIAIPKASQTKHVRDNRAAADIVLTAQDLAELDEAFPPPSRRRSLEMI